MARAIPSPSREAERGLLDLAQRVSAMAAEREPATTPLRVAVETFLAAGSGPLGITLLDAWRAGRTDERAALALAWAREQLRLAIAELLARELAAERLRLDTPLDALAWTFLIAAEASVHELPGSASDRVDALVGLAERPR
jgi:hypothetical protein